MNFETLIESSVEVLSENSTLLKEALSAPMSKSDQEVFNSMTLGKPTSNMSGAPICFYLDSTSAMTIQNGNFLQIWDGSKRQVISIYMNDRNVQFLKKALR